MEKEEDGGEYGERQLKSRAIWGNTMETYQSQRMKNVQQKVISGFAISISSMNFSSFS